MPFSFILDRNVDEDFSALADAAACLFSPEKKLSPHQFSLGLPSPLPVTTVHSIQQEQRKNPQRKQEAFPRNGKFFGILFVKLVIKKSKLFELMHQFSLGLPSEFSFVENILVVPNY